MQVQKIFLSYQLKGLYENSNNLLNIQRNNKKAAKILSNKIKAKIQLIPIEKAKTACLLKYDFIILAGSLYHGKVQGTLKDTYPEIWEH